MRLFFILIIALAIGTSDLKAQYYPKHYRPTAYQVWYAEQLRQAQLRQLYLQRNAALIYQRAWMNQYNLQTQRKFYLNRLQYFNRFAPRGYKPNTISGLGN